MKKIILIVTMLIVATINLAGDFVVGEVQGQVYNDVWGNFDDVPVVIVLADNKIYFKSKTYSETFWLEMDKEQRKMTIMRIDKYLDWEKKAIENNLKTQKDIGIVNTNSATWDGADWYLSNYGPRIQTIFFSQTKINHKMVFRFSEVEHWDNEYITLKPEDIYLQKKQAIKLKQILQEENIRKKIKEKEEQDKRANDILN